MYLSDGTNGPLLEELLEEELELLELLEELQQEEEPTVLLVLLVGCSWEMSSATTDAIVTLKCVL